MSILTLLLVLLLSMVNGATRLWRINENRVDSYREARAAINRIASDLTSIYPSSHLTYFYTQENKLPKTPVKIPGMSGSLFFLTTTPAAAQDSTGNKSDICTVGYFLGYDKTSLTGKGTDSYNLYRYFRSSDDTFDALIAGDILTNLRIETLPTSRNSEVLAKNVIGFTVTSYTIPMNPPDSDSASLSPILFHKTAETPLPDMVEIVVKTISNESAKRFANSKSEWENPDSLTRRQEERSFTTRIYLRGASHLNKLTTPAP